MGKLENNFAKIRERRNKERVPSTVRNVNKVNVRKKPKTKEMQAWSFYLSKADREKLDEMALAHGFVKPSGNANVSAFISAWINDEV